MYLGTTCETRYMFCVLRYCVELLKNSVLFLNRIKGKQNCTNPIKHYIIRIACAPNQWTMPYKMVK